jgi:hypothetical protein
MHYRKETHPTSHGIKQGTDTVMATNIVSEAISISPDKEN